VPHPFHFHETTKRDSSKPPVVAAALKSTVIVPKLKIVAPPKTIGLVHTVEQHGSTGQIAKYSKEETNHILF
jgi:hypothetical protein